MELSWKGVDCWEVGGEVEVKNRDVMLEEVEVEVEVEVEEVDIYTAILGGIQNCPPKIWGISAWATGFCVWRRVVAYRPNPVSDCVELMATHTSSLGNSPLAGFGGPPA